LSSRVRVLVTGAGGIGGCNFIRALRLAEQQANIKYWIVGSDYNKYYILFPKLDKRIHSPKHTDTDFLETIWGFCVDESIDFLHPHPSSEARVISEKIERFKDSKIKTYLPPPSNISPNKLQMADALKEYGVPVTKTMRLRSKELWEVQTAFENFGSPLWIRAITGAGGRLGLKVNNASEAILWVHLNVKQGRANVKDFVLQEYLPGRDIAVDSLWYKGGLITSYARERLEYPFKHISLSGITGTPSVSRIIHDDKINAVGKSAVLAINPKPHGFYSVDIKEDSKANPYVTEVDGKWHTTAPLWGLTYAKLLNDAVYNLADLYVRLGLSEGEYPHDKVPETNLFPEDAYLIRQMDCGVIAKISDKVFKVV